MHMTATINGRPQAIHPGERLIDLSTRTGTEVPHVCYHSQLGPIQFCDTCMVEVDGKLVRACGTVAADGMNVVTSSPRADAAQEPERAYGAILQVSEVESHMRESRTKKTKTVCTYCGVGCSFDVWTKDRHILKVEPLDRAANGVSTCIKGKFSWGHIKTVLIETQPAM
jgi:predicted molibdopterin-dependent oxidoreductase YjgC